ncbi:unnamed protein product [Protopolystoma xenopodis]|uniref:Uncharacterized protein n=1 Tax=Protopolystoma xenopodis TaxID=117903 RepID=A0A3S5A8Q1_9PLAT|nr:unnamed protein product [Protopolystoma xenopodis]
MAQRNLDWDSVTTLVRAIYLTNFVDYLKRSLLLDPTAPYLVDSLYGGGTPIASGGQAGALGGSASFNSGSVGISGISPGMINASIGGAGAGVAGLGFSGAVINNGGGVGGPERSSGGIGHLHLSSIAGVAERGYHGHSSHHTVCPASGPYGYRHLGKYIVMSSSGQHACLDE